MRGTSSGGKVKERTNQEGELEEITRERGADYWKQKKKKEGIEGNSKWRVKWAGGEEQDGGVTMEGKARRVGG